MKNTTHNLLALLTLILAFSFTTTTEAKVFRNAYVSFELPDLWNCVLEHTEWVCRSSNDKQSREAIIVLTAKEVGPTDTMAAYITHLNTPQPLTYKGAGVGSSRVFYPPKTNKINDHDWVDGLHLASEVPNYYTRYVATIKDKIAILVTFSAHKDFYTRYSQDFFKAVASLRVIATKNLLASPEMGPIRPTGETLGGPIGAAIPGDMAGTEAQGPAPSKSSRTKNLLLGLAAILAAVGAYIFMKSK